MSRLFADFVVIVHFAFILFVILGALLVVKWPWMIWFHIPAMLWGALIEFTGWTCPLTPLENWLRECGGEGGYHSGFLDHYILPLMYPSDLSRWWQIVLGTLVLIINLIIYSSAFIKKRESRGIY